MVEPTGPKLVPAQTVARRRSAWWALLALALVLAGLVCALVGQFEWGMALWGIAFWPTRKSDALYWWADGYSAGVLTGVKASDMQLSGSYAEGWKDAHDHARENGWK